MVWQAHYPYVFLLLILFVVASTVFLHWMPGLLGDEGSEGQNVYEILHAQKKFTVLGERSYISPLIDYVRIPFVFLFGYSVLALRIPVFLFSLMAFFLALSVFGRLLGQQSGLPVVVMIFFSPIYLLYQRLGWVISLLPFFALLLLFVMLIPIRSRPLLAGFIAGLGVSTHILFFPTVVGVFISAALGGFLRHGLRSLVVWWPAMLGFWAGFGTQFGVMNMYQEDQGRPFEVAAQFWDRVVAVPAVLPAMLSGSAYISRYTGEFLPPALSWTIVAVVIGLSIVALTLPPTRRLAWLWFFGLFVQLGVLLVLIDRFTLRYFVVFALGVWALAGMGLGVGIARFSVCGSTCRYLSSLIVGVLLASFVVAFAFIPFSMHGGGIRAFSQGDPISTADAMVDLRPLLLCLRGRGIVYSDNVHLGNRLLFLQHRYPDLSVTVDKKEAHVLVRHRSPRQLASDSSELCSDLKNFRVVPYRYQGA